MSFKVELSLEGKTYEVNRLMVNFNRQTDARGRPASLTAWGIEVEIESPASDDSTITSWMIDPVKALSGKITVYKIDQASKESEITFKNCHLIRLDQSFSSDHHYIRVQMSIVGQEIVLRASKVKIDWPE